MIIDSHCHLNYEPMSLALDETINRANKIGACVITCMSLSKTYAMTGWRIGYSVGPY